MAKELKIDLTSEQRERMNTSAIAYSFRVSGEGRVSIREHWDGHDELWSDGCTVEIPGEIWLVAERWLHEAVRF